MRIFTVTFLSLSLLSCTTMRLKYEADIEARKGNAGTPTHLELERSVQTTGHMAACAITGILYGGWCWAYLLMPFDSQELEVQTEAENLLRMQPGGADATLANGRFQRISWSSGPQSIKFTTETFPAPATISTDIRPISSPDHGAVPTESSHPVMPIEPAKKPEAKVLKKPRKRSPPMPTDSPPAADSPPDSMFGLKIGASLPQGLATKNLGLAPGSSDLRTGRITPPAPDSLLTEYQIWLDKSDHVNTIRGSFNLEKAGALPECRRRFKALAKLNAKKFGSAKIEKLNVAELHTWLWPGKAGLTVMLEFDKTGCDVKVELGNAW